MLGHGYPVLLGFGGGKGVATGAGAALALFPAGVGIAALAWAIIFFTLRYASVASLAAGTAFLVAAVALGERVAGDRVRGSGLRLRRLPPPRQHRAAAGRDGAASPAPSRRPRVRLVTSAAWMRREDRPH